MPSIAECEKSRHVKVEHTVHHEAEVQARQSEIQSREKENDQLRMQNNQLIEQMVRLSPMRCGLRHTTARPIVITNSRSYKRPIRCYRTVSMKRTFN